MTDGHDEEGGPFDPREPARDVRLGMRLREIVGAAPVDEVDWRALEARIGAAVRSAHPTPWWRYAERWGRRAVPLAIAAGLIGALVIWDNPNGTPVEVATTSGTADVVSTIMAGGSPLEAAVSFTRTVTSAVDVSSGAQE